LLPSVEAKLKSSPLAGRSEVAERSVANVVGLAFEAAHLVALS